MNGRRRTRHISPFLLLALLLHYLVLTIVPLFSFWKVPPAPDVPFEVSVVDVPADPEAEKKKEEEEREKERTPKGQVVELPKPAEERQPDDARFVSEFDSRVKKETRARRRGDAASQPPAQEKQPHVATRERPDPGIELPEAADGERSGRPSQGAPRVERLPTLEELKPTEEQLRRAIGSRQMDYLDDVEDGEDTLLNSKRWKFASYFNRVKRQVAENWHPELAYRRRDPYGNIYGYRDRMTVLRVHLDPLGNLEQLLLERPCGVDFLDDEAMQAFRAAQPFPNPPRQLIDPETGLISFRFGFIFEIATRPTFKVYRPSD